MLAEDVVPAETRLALAASLTLLSLISYHSVSALGSSTGTFTGTSISGRNVTAMQIHT